MAVTPLQAESACENTEQKKTTSAFFRAHAQFRHAQARWNLALYAPDMVDDDLPQEVGDTLCEDTWQAQEIFMQTPAPTLGALVWKMRVFQQEDLHEADKAGEFFSHLVNDGERLLREARHGK